MSDQPVRVLLIEDSSTFRAAIQGFLADTFLGPVETISADCLAKGIEHLREPRQVDVVLLDLMLPDSEGPQTFRLVQSAAGSIPIVLLTGVEDEEMGVRLIRQGAQDYLAKNQVNRDSLARALRYAIERAGTERQLADARDAEVESARLKSQFLAMMSHEIRTPMNDLIGMANLLRDTDLDAEQQEYARTVSICAESLLALLDDILDFSKIEAGKLTFESVSYDLHEVAGQAVELLAERAKSKGIELVVLIEESVPRWAHGDPGRLRQVLVNLIGNAVKFTDSGSVALRAEHRTQPGEDAEVQFSVRDTGVGIAPEVQKALFRPFVQADSTTTRRYGGTGLGLAISKQLVEGMGGQIGVESSLGSGSTFWFRIKLGKAHRQAQVSQAPAPELAGRRVLVVDHHPANSEVMQYYLKSWRLRPTLATSGNRALALLYKKAESGVPYDLAVVDDELEDVKGLELARTMHSDQILADTPVVLLRPFGNRLDPSMARLAGVTAVLSKPFLRDRLLETLTRLFVPTRATEESEPQQPVKEASPTGSSARELSILLAEDNAVNQMLAVRLLEKIGFRADVVENGLDAVDRVRSGRYNLVLMDCQMPEMDGYQATAEIRRLEAGKRHTNIVAVTANAMRGDREKCLTAGMDDYLAKPIQLAKLKSVLERWSQVASAEQTKPSPSLAASGDDER